MTSPIAGFLLRDGHAAAGELNALVARSRNAEIDTAYAAYDAHPLDEPDDWGDLASFRDAAASA